MSEEYNSSAPESGVSEPSLLAKIAGVFLDPKRTFTSLDRKPDFIVPMVIMMVVALASAIILWPLIQELIAEQMSDAIAEGQVPAEQLETIQKSQRIAALVGAPLGAALQILAIALVMFFAGNILIGGQSSYKKILSVFAYTSLIGILASAVTIILAQSKGSMEVYTSLAALFPGSAKDTVLFKVAGVFDLFKIWELIVASIGMSIVYKVTTQKALSVLGSIYLIFSAVVIIISSL